MKKAVILVLIMFFLNNYTKAMGPQSMLKALITKELPGMPVDEQTKLQMRELLESTNHKNPDKVEVRWYDENFSKKSADACYVPILNTIFLDKRKITPFTMAHEAAHATFHANFWFDLLTFSLGYGAVYGLLSKKSRFLPNISMGKQLLGGVCVFIKIKQQRELQADVEGARALLKLGNCKAVEERLQSLSGGDIKLNIGNETKTERVLRFIAEQYSGFYFEKDNKYKLVIDRKKGTSETLISNWRMHPTPGKRFFAIKSALEEKTL